MILEMRKEDIFNHVGEENARFVQCLSADFKAGAGIALEFNKYFDIKNELSHFRKFWNGSGYMIKVPGTPVFNLITKQFYYDKPTLNNLIEALNSFSKYYIREGYDESFTIYMPKIGCGLDKLKWGDVENAIRKIFNDVNIHIVVCYI